MALAVAHEGQQLAGLALAFGGAEDGAADIFGILPGFQQRAAQIDGLETVGMADQPADEQALHLAEFLPGHHMQGLDAHHVHLLPGQLFQTGGHVTDVHALLFQLGPDDAGGIGPDHGAVGEGGLEFLVDGGQGGLGLGHAGAEGHQQQPFLLGRQGRQGQAEGEQQGQQRGAQGCCGDTTHGTSSMTR